MTRSSRMTGILCFLARIMGVACVGVFVWFQEASSGEPSTSPSTETNVPEKPFDGDTLWLPPQEKPKLDPSYLKRLGPNGKVKTPEQAMCVAIEKLRRARQVGADEGPRVIGLVGSGVEIPGYAMRGDKIWIIRFMDMTLCVTQEAWVSSTTGEVRWIFPIDTPPAPIKPAKDTRVRGN